MKHAILVMAHDNFQVLKKCLQLIDDDRFDFYIHIDRKNPQDEFNFDEACKYSKVFLTERIPVYWGHHSITEAMLLLLKSAVNESYKYDYYHLISGADMPIKTPSEINQFFEKNSGKEFVTIRGLPGIHDWRMKYRYPFIKEYKRTKYTFINNIQKAIYSRILRFPRYNGTDVLRDKGWSVYMGDAWWSITDRFARTLCALSDELMPYWQNCHASDETLAQTALMNLPSFKKSQSNKMTRLIDWSRGRPYTWEKENFEEIMQSEALFVRKIDCVDLELADLILCSVMKKKCQGQKYCYK